MEKISLVFFHGYEKNPYAGPLRPFINWGETLIKDYPKVDFHLILFRSNPKIIESFTHKLRNKTILIDDDKELLKTIKYLDPDIVFSDDYFPRLKVLEKIKKNIKVKTGVYIQILYGLHSISNCFYYDQIPFREKFLYKLSSFIPYKLLSMRYVKMIRSHDFFISNSKASKNLFYWLYKIPVKDFIYPPVNTEVFKPSINSVERNNTLVYLGSSGGDINSDFTLKVIKTLSERKFNISLFGNEKIGKVVRNSLVKDVEFFKDLTDAELAKLYSKQLVTICPQTWEIFGYTAVESMACGTPVLAFNYFGHSETIINRKTGMLANTENEFINNLELLLKGLIKFDRDYIRKYTTKNFSAERSTNNLVKIIEKVLKND